MSLTVDVLGVGPVPIVRLRADVPGAWSVHGTSGERSWEVASGVGPRWLSDPWAPLNAPVSYELRSAGSVEVAGPVVRAYVGENLLTDLRGRGAVDFRWYGDDEGSMDLRASFFDVPGSTLSPYLAAPVAGAGAGSLVARTQGAATVAMTALVAANQPVILHHNHALCRVPGCDVPPVRTILLTGAPQGRTGRTDVAERSWSLTYRLVPSPWGFVPPVATVADVRDHFSSVGDLASAGLTVGGLAAGGWLVAS